MERVPAEHFLEELEELLNEGIGMAGGGHPAEYDIRRALGEQVKEYTMRRMRRLISREAARDVLLPEAPDGWCREDWDEVNRNREDWDR